MNSYNSVFLAILFHPTTLLLLGGGLGANARYWLGIWFHQRGWTREFPWHTFLINVLGSIFLGFIVVKCKGNPWLFTLLGAGFCGGFTTFSTFSIETVQLLEANRIAAALGYTIGSASAAVAGAWLGLRYAS